MDQKPVQGIVLLLSTVILGAAIQGFLFEHRHGAEMREQAESLRKLEQAQGEAMTNMTSTLNRFRLPTWK